MGQKVNPRGLRLGITETWRSRWFGGKDYGKYIGEDVKVRKFLKERLVGAAIGKIEIERAGSRTRVVIHSAKPGIVIGKKGKDSDELKKELKRIVGREVSLNIVEVRKPDLDAQLVGESIAFQLERRVNFRRAVRDAMNRVVRAGGEGVKVCVGGRLNGAEIARSEKYKEGRTPLHTLRADIDYGVAEAATTYGIIGIKVWIFKGERYGENEMVPAEAIQF